MVKQEPGERQASKLAEKKNVFIIKVHYCNIIIRRKYNLRTFALIVSAHPYCARKFTRYVMHRACALNNKMMLGQVAIAIALPGFNDLGRGSVTPIFNLMNHVLCRFSMFSEKMTKIYRLEV